MRLLRKYSGWLALAAVIAVVISMMLWVTPTYRVATGSMRPTMPVGSLVITHHESSYKPGDVITFHANGGEVVTHRLVNITKSGEYITKGDANSTRDYWKDPVTKSDIMGKVLFVTTVTTAAFWTSPRGIGIIICLVVMGLALFWKIEDEEESEKPSAHVEADPA